MNLAPKPFRPIRRRLERTPNSPEPTLSLVEDAYRRAVDQMTVADKFQRMHELNAWARWNIGQRIIEAEGPLPDEVLKWRIALWIYGRQPEVRRLTEEQLARVSARGIPTVAEPDELNA